MRQFFSFLVLALTLVALTSPIRASAQSGQNLSGCVVNAGGAASIAPPYMIWRVRNNCQVTAIVTLEVAFCGHTENRFITLLPGLVAEGRENFKASCGGGYEIVGAVSQ